MKVSRHQKYLRFTTIKTPSYLTTPTLPPTNPHRPFSSPALGAEDPTLHLVRTAILSSQWQSIPSNLSPSQISAILPTLHASPDDALSFIQRLDFNHLDLPSLSLAAVILSRLPSPRPALHLLNQAIATNLAPNRQIFDALAAARSQLKFSSTHVFDLLIRAACASKNPDDGLQTFYLMNARKLLPKIESCNDLLSAFLRSNQTDKAWVLFAEMFRSKIPLTVVTFNIMINVLCKDGEGRHVFSSKLRRGGEGQTRQQQVDRERAELNLVAEAAIASPASFVGMEREGLSRDSGGDGEKAGDGEGEKGRETERARKGEREGARRREGEKGRATKREGACAGGNRFHFAARV